VAVEVSDGKRMCSRKKATVAHVLQIPRLHEPIPTDGGWVTVDDDYAMIFCAMCSHIQADSPFMPFCELQERVMYLVVIPARLGTRYQLARFLLGLDNSAHLSVPCAQVSSSVFMSPVQIALTSPQTIPVHAMRLEPITRGGLMVVDGELIEDSPVQVVATDYMATMCGRKT
jgi:hypothetical protein